MRPRSNNASNLDDILTAATLPARILSQVSSTDLVRIKSCSITPLGRCGKSVETWSTHSLGTGLRCRWPLVLVVSTIIAKYFNYCWESFYHRKQGLTGKEIAINDVQDENQQRQPTDSVHLFFASNCEVR